MSNALLARRLIADSMAFRERQDAPLLAQRKTAALRRRSSVFARAGCLTGRRPSPRGAVFRLLSPRSPWLGGIRCFRHLGRLGCLFGAAASAAALARRHHPRRQARPIFARTSPRISSQLPLFEAAAMAVSASPATSRPWRDHLRRTASASASFSGSGGFRPSRSRWLLRSPATGDRSTLALLLDTPRRWHSRWPHHWLRYRLSSAASAAASASA